MQEEIERLRSHLSKALEAAERTDRARNEFLSAVAHEIRTPTASILGYVEILLEEAGDDLSDRHREYLHIIHKSGEHISQLIEDLLDLEEVTTGELSLEIETTELSPIVADVRSELYPLAEQGDLTLKTDVDPGVCAVRADANRLRQVLVNLVSNAIKFTEEGTVTIRATQTDPDPTDGQRHSRAVLEVRDTGIGIHPDFLPYIFERFSREKRTEHTGSGLGLTISRELVERMGGSIEVESTLGEGSTFRVYLPCESLDA